MIPKSRIGEKIHRKRKRQMEILLSVNAIEEVQKKVRPNNKSKQTSILEFGCGDGFQIPYLKRLGTVVGSDVYKGELNDMSGAAFIECDVTDTPFEDESFDVLYSNHVVEHIENLDAAFHEMHRIGNEHCIYAFSVPTNIWLALSLPAQYLSKIKAFLGLFWSKTSKRESSEKKGPITNLNAVKKNESLSDKLLRILGPSGHGVTENYIECYRNFRVGSWEKLFSDNGFTVVDTRQLLLYGPSEWPLIPIITPKFGFSSSVLFLMVKSPS
jgi:ubiquinone/menaquinone biosynthesis C-methylase UbiE